MVASRSGGRSPTERATLATAGFSGRSDLYERSRPTYPAAAIALLKEMADLAPDRRVLDVAAGTGKLTRQICATGAGCIAVEPSPTMREVCRRVVPGAAVVAGTAEDLPVATDSIDLVTAAQAFHWFDAPRALAEMSRVLGRGGVMALIWNTRDERVPWVAALGRVLADAGGASEGRAGALVGSVPLDALEGFHQHRFDHVASLDRAGLVDLVASRSYVNVLGARERALVLERITAFAAQLAEPIDFPYVTEVFTARDPQWSDPGRAPAPPPGQDIGGKEEDRWFA